MKYEVLVAVSTNLEKGITDTNYFKEVLNHESIDANFVSFENLSDYFKSNLPPDVILIQYNSRFKTLGLKGGIEDIIGSKKNRKYKNTLVFAYNGLSPEEENILELADHYFIIGDSHSIVETIIEKSPKFYKE